MSSGGNQGLVIDLVEHCEDFSGHVALESPQRVAQRDRAGPRSPKRFGGKPAWQVGVQVDTLWRRCWLLGVWSALACTSRRWRRLGPWLAQPQRRLGGLHRLVDHGEQLCG